jgi:hypothetical protein
MTKERDYSKGLIYKIEHLDKPNLVYVGSTINFNKRKYRHKQCCNNEKSKDYNNKKYKMIRENDGWECFKMAIIKLWPCKSKLELDIEEEKCRKELQSVLNERRCHITEEERIEQKKEWCQTNKEYQKEYFEENKEKIKEQQKEYREENKEKIKEQQKEYREENKQKILEKSKEKIDCICGKTFMYCNKARHEKSVKHQTFINK